MIFFFKQKTAYEMNPSDWSSDVCSSDLSTVAGELGSSDTLRDPRGFALKFYTDEGNYDLVGNNTPIFFKIGRASCRERV